MQIRKLLNKDHKSWLKLYEVYAKHYQVLLSDTGIAVTWSWLMTDGYPTQGLVAEESGKLVGLAHFRAMPSPLRGHEIGFIDDIVVLPNYRGLGISEALFEKIKRHGNKCGWVTIRWITKDNNYRARKVYDKLATKTDWNLYEMDCN